MKIGQEAGVKSKFYKNGYIINGGTMDTFLIAFESFPIFTHLRWKKKFTGFVQIASLFLDFIRIWVKKLSTFSAFLKPLNRIGSNCNRLVRLLGQSRQPLETACVWKFSLGISSPVVSKKEIRNGFNKKNFQKKSATNIRNVING